FCFPPPFASLMTLPQKTLSQMRLLLVSHVPHFVHAGRLWAYGPYAREVDTVWASLFASVCIAAPVKHEPPPADATPFANPNITLADMPEFSGGRLEKGSRLADLPKLGIAAFRLLCLARRTDVVHLRNPGNLGLLGALLGPLLGRRRIAKYAGQWNGFPGEAWTVRLERRLLRSRWWGAPVLVYGQWPQQPAHVVPFFTSVLTENQMAQARQAAANRISDVRSPNTPLRLLYVGRLSREKHVDTIIHAVAALHGQGDAVTCTLVGHGAADAELRALAATLGVNDVVTFAGGVPFEKITHYYETHDVLALISETEGWPKAIAEAMAFGLICIGSDRSIIPQMLGDNRGLVVPPGDVDALAKALRQVAAWPAAQQQETSRRSATWGQRFTLENLRDAIRDLLTNGTRPTL
ncbi:MAG: glycosyltransferase, partial [Lentisphaeria bacterium]